MDISELDIVYCVKDAPENEELRYSLRSLVNFPHRDVYIYGGCPEWVNRDTVKYVSVTQNKGNKWLNTSELLSQIVNNEDISENFVWFNDDFFILKPIQELDYFYDRTLNSRVMDFYKISWYTTMNGYCTRLKIASRALKLQKENTLNYELHVPIIFNREKLKQIFKKYPYIGAKRSLYCNTFVKGGIQRPDVKIYDNERIPEEDWEFVSTSDKSFIKGQVGKYIRKEFKKKCEYEKVGKFGKNKAEFPKK